MRIARACRELGIRSVAVYSDADRFAPHVLAADEAHRIGGPAASDSYLRADRIVQLGKDLGVDAVHPGYGFLAERAPFAEEVVAAGMVFVGPDTESIGVMGDKTRSRQRMQEAGVPIVPGAVSPVASASEARELAQALGYPVLLKAAAGGGGKGMRVVSEPEAIEPAMEAAAREALNAFGDGSVYIERYLSRPRHIEIQVLGDRHGTVLHLGERECSVQRRHQKLIEEAPSPVITPAEREEMGRAAVRAAASVGYVGAGTVEFLYQDGEFFFLEMNTRLQVEHPVTEYVTGIDLVEWQFRVAAGEALPWAQDDIRMAGHAMECRITAEVPETGFLPSTGSIRSLSIPGGPGVRWDGGIRTGYVVGLEYDSLLGKLIVHDVDRERAIRRMARALSELEIVGVETCAHFHRRVMADPDFRRGDLTIRFLEEHPELASPKDDGDLTSVAVLAALLEHARTGARSADRETSSDSTGFSAWRRAGLPGAGR